MEFTNKPGSKEFLTTEQLFFFVLEECSGIWYEWDEKPDLNPYGYFGTLTIKSDAYGERILIAEELLYKNFGYHLYNLKIANHYRGTTEIQISDGWLDKLSIGMIDLTHYSGDVPDLPKTLINIDAHNAYHRTDTGVLSLPELKFLDRLRYLNIEDSSIEHLPELPEGIQVLKGTRGRLSQLRSYVNLPKSLEEIDLKLKKH